MRPARSGEGSQMERNIEITARSAVASMEGETATIEVVTDYGRLTLRMHRIAFGNLAGEIARALWQKVAEEDPAISAAESHGVPGEGEAQEPASASVGAVGATERPVGGFFVRPDILNRGNTPDGPIQPASQEPEWEAVGAGGEVHEVPIEPAAQESEEEAAGAGDAGDVQGVPIQPAPQESEGEAVGAGAETEA